MSLLEISQQLAATVNKVVYIQTSPETLDFTSKIPGKIIVHGSKGSVEIEVDGKNVLEVMGLLGVTIFDKEQVSTLVCWNIKSIISYFRYYNPKFVTIGPVIIDLKVIEKLRGINKTPPINLVEAVNRMNILTRNVIWKHIYRKVHMPLMLRTLPTIETTGLLNKEARHAVFPYYEIEGQANGRLNSYTKFKRSFHPHNMGDDVKRLLKPRGYGSQFLMADYRHCEATVLQWLSGDPKLKTILESGEDLYKSIYKTITGDECNSENKRVLIKKIFLPVMYGFGSAGLAKALGISENVSRELVKRINIEFKTAWDWMEGRQKIAEEAGVLEDDFGRKRAFDQPYKARNFSVQGVAATVCQEKLIDLCNTLDPKSANVVMSVHDGFGIVFRSNVIDQVRNALQSESKLCPGLSMKVEVKVGDSLDDMKVV